MPAAGGIGCLPSLSVHSTGPRGTAWCGVHLQIVRLHGRVGHTADDAGGNFRTTSTPRWSIGGKLWLPVKPYCFCPTQASDRWIGRMQSEQSDVVEPFGVHPPTTCVHGVPHTWSRSMVSGGRSEPVECGSKHGLHHAGGSASRDAGHATRRRGNVQKKRWPSPLHDHGPLDQTVLSILDTALQIDGPHSTVDTSAFLQFTHTALQTPMEDSNFTLATIHGSKGSEYDHVVLYQYILGASKADGSRCQPHRDKPVAEQRTRKKLVVHRRNPGTSNAHVSDASYHTTRAERTAAVGYHSLLGSFAMMCPFFMHRGVTDHTDTASPEGTAPK